MGPISAQIWFYSKSTQVDFCLYLEDPAITSHSCVHWTTYTCSYLELPSEHWIIQALRTYPDKLSDFHHSVSQDSGTINPFSTPNSHNLQAPLPPLPPIPNNSLGLHYPPYLSSPPPTSPPSPTLSTTSSASIPWWSPVYQAEQRDLEWKKYLEEKVETIERLQREVGYSAEKAEKTFDKSRRHIALERFDRLQSELKEEDIDLEDISIVAVKEFVDSFYSSSD